MLTEDQPFNQVTSNIGHNVNPTIQAIYNGLNRYYYQMVIDYNKNEND